MRYRKKPVVIDAFQLQDPDKHADAVEDLHAWAGEHGFTNWSSDEEGIVIVTLEGDMLARPGDWIIKGVKGEFYPCKPDIFAATYDPVEERGGE
jgi:hypothetical protein